MGVLCFVEGSRSTHVAQYSQEDQGMYDTQHNYGSREEGGLVLRLPRSAEFYHSFVTVTLPLPLEFRRGGWRGRRRINTCVLDMDVPLDVRVAACRVFQLDFETHRKRL